MFRHLKFLENNDIYVYIEKNSGYSKQEIIASVKLDNFNITTKPTVGEIKIYKPTVNDTTLFQNLEENEVTELVFEGTESTDMSNLQISCYRQMPVPCLYNRKASP